MNVDLEQTKNNVYYKTCDKTYNERLKELIDENNKNDYHVGKYGHLRLQYLKEYKKAEYSIMLLDGTLRKHIIDTDIQATERLEILINQMLDKNPIDESLKDTDPLK